MDIFDDVPETERPGSRRPAAGAPQDAPGRSRRASDHEMRGAYRRLRAQFLERWAAAREECAFGDGPIDYELRHGDPRAATLHHTVPVVLRPDLEMETSLWKPAHFLCNRLGQAAFAADGAGSDYAAVAGEPPHVGPEPDTGWPSAAWMIP